MRTIPFTSRGNGTKAKKVIVLSTTKRNIRTNVGFATRISILHSCMRASGQICLADGEESTNPCFAQPLFDINKCACASMSYVCERIHRRIQHAEGDLQGNEGNDRRRRWIRLCALLWISWTGILRVNVNEDDLLLNGFHT